jgi:hypothetical protein
MVQLWENLLFWKKRSMKKLKEFKDYRLFDYEDASGRSATGIELFVKEYEGVLYHYQEARIIEEGEMGRLQFGYSIIDPGNHTITDLHKDEKFVNIMGEILEEVLLKKVNDEQTGKNNPQKFSV